MYAAAAQTVAKGAQRVRRLCGYTSRTFAGSLLPHGARVRAGLAVVCCSRLSWRRLFAASWGERWLMVADPRSRCAPHFDGTARQQCVSSAATALWGVDDSAGTLRPDRRGDGTRHRAPALLTLAEMSHLASQVPASVPARLRGKQMVMDRSRKALSPLHPSRDPECKQKGGGLTPTPQILSSRRRGGKQSGERFAQGKFPFVPYQGTAVPFRRHS